LMQDQISEVRKSLNAVIEHCIEARNKLQELCTHPKPRYEAEDRYGTVLVCPDCGHGEYKHLKDLKARIESATRGSEPIKAPAEPD